VFKVIRFFIITVRTQIREEYKPWAFESKALRRILGPEREEMTGD
jgi:hypothetical protein